MIMRVRMEQAAVIMIVVAISSRMLMFLDLRRGLWTCMSVVTVPVIVLVRAAAARARYAPGHREKWLG